ncbi:hypothetical protein BPAE_0019g00710 [Botrytis paeoniae]|uniref:Uncharacterized protein n=1 Tax=Botrytis paeoniae TaxID=278948 RepID=A0A4Z1FX50_9HELO|nr:hypothetical protein BPAE_0019g00710 [Botrytis paeoniae]
MSSRSYQPTPQMSYKAPPVSLPTQPPPSKSVASYRQPSNSYQDGPQTPPATYIPTDGRSYKAEPQSHHKPEQTPHRDRTATSSTTYQKSGSTYPNVAKTARPVRQGSDISAAEAAIAQIRRENAARAQELSRMVPGSAGQMQQPALERRNHQSGPRSCDISVSRSTVMEVQNQDSQGSDWVMSDGTCKERIKLFSSCKMHEN